MRKRGYFSGLTAKSIFISLDFFDLFDETIVLSGSILYFIMHYDSTTVNTCRSVPNSPYKTNRDDSTLHIRNLFSPQSSSQSTTSNSHTFSPIISSTPHPVKIKTNPNSIHSDVRPQRTRTEPKSYGNTIPSDLIPKVQKK